MQYDSMQYLAFSTSISQYVIVLFVSIITQTMLETKIQICNRWVLKLSVKWKWNMLRDRNMFYGQSKIIGVPGPHHDNVIFLGVNGNLIACHNP